MIDTSYILDVNYIDLNGVMLGVSHHYEKGDPIIKYSKAEHSPVSPQQSKTIQLGTPELYNETDTSQGLVYDSSEGKFIEDIMWNKRQSEPTEMLKNSVSQSLPGISNVLKGTITYKYHSSFWLYCTCVDPILSHKRKEQRIQSNPEYNYMSLIDKPNSFAEQLGNDIMKQIDINKDLKCDARGRHILISASFGRKNVKDNYFISVEHGPIVYLDGEKKSEFINLAHAQLDQDVFLFVKDKKYEVQQEYRFVIRILFHSPQKKKYLLNVSKDLRKLMSPVE